MMQWLPPKELSMKKIFRSALLAMTALFFSASVQAANPEDTLVMETTKGPVVIEMRPDLAPKHVARIKELVRSKFYDGVPFHRVIEGFMAQTGDPTGTGTGGSGQNLPAEFSKEHHVRGTVSMARASAPDSADSQFFICFADTPHLDGQYTVWGRVIEGMDNVDKIKRGNEAAGGQVTDPDKVVSIRVKSDLDKAAAGSAAPAATTTAPAKPAQ
jgi:peptidylprolyl isomerase